MAWGDGIGYPGWALRFALGYLIMPLWGNAFDRNMAPLGQGERWGGEWYLMSLSPNGAKGEIPG